MTDAETQSLQASATQSNAKNKGGRPTTFNDVTATIICERIASGETLTSVCKTPGMPKPQTVHRWRRKYRAFGEEYAIARIDQAESWGDESIDISDDDSLDTMDGPKGGQVANHANVQRDRLRIDTRKFLMSKIAPRIYGDKTQHEHSGEVEHKHTVELSDRERMRRLASFMLEDQAAGVTIDAQPIGVTLSDSNNCNDPQPNDRAKAANIVHGKPNTNE